MGSAVMAITEWGNGLPSLSKRASFQLCGLSTIIFHACFIWSELNADIVQKFYSRLVYIRLKNKHFIYINKYKRHSNTPIKAESIIIRLSIALRM